MSLQISIKTVTRTTPEGVIEKLDLKPGVNILQGPPNSGKTVWLHIIDFLMGDTGSIEEVLANEDSSGNKLYEKYASASMIVSVGDKELLIERKWKEPGARGKVFINGIAILASDFSDQILNELRIPVLHFPKGNPFTDKAWPSLSWRMMLRHIFRQEDFWSDLADRQPEIEQHAVLCQFLGIAEKLFSQQFGDVIDKRKLLLRMEAEKEQFGSILDNIGRSMAGPSSEVTFLTHESIKSTIEGLEVRIKGLLSERQAIIDREVTKIEAQNQTTSNVIIEKTQERETLINQINDANLKQRHLIGRIAEFKSLQSTINQEIDKLKRTKQASGIFSDLKITHCPACDQEISISRKSDSETCFLCHQPTTKERSDNRLDFEIAQLSGEQEELASLLAPLQEEFKDLDEVEEKLKYQLSLIERQIAPLRGRVTALVSPEVGGFDAERGRLQEQIESLKRLAGNLDHKRDLEKKIDVLNSEISKLEGLIESQEDQINYEEVSSILEEEIANYLNLLNKNNPDRWPHKRPRFRIGEKGFTLKVNEGRWSKTIGATSKLYFLFAYHYGLLALTKSSACHYPGLLIVDFPPELPNTEKNIVFTENYVVEPFIELCKTTDIPMQVIMTGNAFQGLEGVNKVIMNKTWD